MSEYAQFWRDVRVSRGLSQFEFAAHAGVGGQFVSNVERDLCRYSIRHIRRLIRRLALNPNEILELVLLEEEKKIRAVLK
jgi:transcriptional regulator with XRE-family HTH domain